MAGQKRERMVVNLLKMMLVKGLYHICVVSIYLGLIYVVCS